MCGKKGFGRRGWNCGKNKEIATPLKIK